MISIHLCVWILDNFGRDKEDIGDTRNVCLEKDSENSMDEENKLWGNPKKKM